MNGPMNEGTSEESVLLLLGQIKERTENHGRMLAAIQIDVAAIKTGATCPRGIEQTEAIVALGTRIGKIEGIGKKVVLAVLAVAVGSVGIEKALTIVLTAFGFGG